MSSLDHPWNGLLRDALKENAVDELFRLIEGLCTGVAVMEEARVDVLDEAGGDMMLLRKTVYLRNEWLGRRRIKTGCSKMQTCSNEQSGLYTSSA